MEQKEKDQNEARKANNEAILEGINAKTSFRRTIWAKTEKGREGRKRIAEISSYMHKLVKEGKDSRSRTCKGKRLILLGRPNEDPSRLRKGAETGLSGHSKFKKKEKGKILICLGQLRM